MLLKFLQSFRSARPITVTWNTSPSLVTAQGKRTQSVQWTPLPGLQLVKSGMAARIIFFYPGEEGTYMDAVFVALYSNGLVQILSPQEEVTTHLRNCEIVWSFDLDSKLTSGASKSASLISGSAGSSSGQPHENSEGERNKVRYLKPQISTQDSTGFQSSIPSNTTPTPFDGKGNGRSEGKGSEKYDGKSGARGAKDKGKKGAPSSSGVGPTGASAKPGSGLPQPLPQPIPSSNPGASAVQPPVKPINGGPSESSSPFDPTFE